MNIQLPKLYQESMKTLLGEEYEQYLESFERPSSHGIRVNTRKWTPEECVSAMRKSGLCESLTPIPWIPNGLFYKEGVKLSKNPYYYAGLYYLQEPSAMTPASVLPVNPGDRVLDLCAAPGGKSTELGVKLMGKGLLFANDISNSRAKALLKNLELFGIPNICVTSESPERLAAVYPEYFDKILVDAPCSGEGMFRRAPDMVKDWLEKGPEYYGPVQREIVEQALKMLKPGGVMVYSTCTFSRTEDEEVILEVLERHREMEGIPVPKFEGACGGIGLSGCIRLFPHKIRGEGHFLAMLRKKEERMPEGGETFSKENGQTGEREAGQRILEEKERRTQRKGMEIKGRCPAGKENGKMPRQLQKNEEFMEFMDKLPGLNDPGRFFVLQDFVYYLPEDFTFQAGLRYLRTGLLAGSIKNGRFEPSQALAMTLSEDTFPDSVSFSVEDERVIRYLKGETILLADKEKQKKGWCLVCVDGFALGFAKGAGMVLKNKYYPGWRWM